MNVRGTYITREQSPPLDWSLDEDGVFTEKNLRVYLAKNIFPQVNEITTVSH